MTEKRDKIKFRDFFLLILALAAQRPKVQAGHAALNFKNMHKNDLLCKECDLKEEESQEHVMVCPGWRDERADLDLSTTMGMVEFIKRIMRRKMK